MAMEASCRLFAVCLPIRISSSSTWLLLQLSLAYSAYIIILRFIIFIFHIASMILFNLKLGGGVYTNIWGCKHAQRPNLHFKTLNRKKCTVLGGGCRLSRGGVKISLHSAHSWETFIKVHLYYTRNHIVGKLHRVYTAIQTIRVTYIHITHTHIYSCKSLNLRGIFRWTFYVLAGICREVK